MRLAVIQSRAVDESLALADLSGALLDRGHRPRLFLDRHEPRLAAVVRRWDPELLIVQAAMLGEPWLMDVLGRLPSIPVVLVGTGITFEPELLLRAMAVRDGVVGIRGELDDALPAFVDGAGIEDLPGGVWFDGELRTNEVGEFPSLDGRPLPHRGLYFDRYPFLGRFPWKRFASGRGCIHACGYCYAAPLRAMHQQAKRGVRRKSVDRVIAEVLAVQRQWPLERVHFCDDLFLPKVGWLEEFAERWPNEIGVPFSCNSSPETMTPRNAGLLAAAGARLVGLGVESGIDALRHGPLGRPTETEVIRAAVSRLKAAGIQVQTFNMLGFPGETLDDALETVKLNQEMGADRVRATLAWPMPGSAMHLDAAERGLPDDMEEATKGSMRAVCVEDRAAFESLSALFRLGVVGRIPVGMLRAMTKVPVSVLRPLTLYDGFQELRWSGVSVPAGLAYALRAGRPVHRVTYHAALP